MLPKCQFCHKDADALILTKKSKTIKVKYLLNGNVETWSLGPQVDYDYTEFVKDLVKKGAEIIELVRKFEKFDEGKQIHICKECWTRIM